MQKKCIRNYFQNLFGYNFHVEFTCRQTKHLEKKIVAFVKSNNLLSIVFLCLADNSIFALCELNGK